MELLAAISSIAIALTLGAMSPGPSFVMVARTAVALSRTDGLAAAVGMGVGAVFFAAIALLGLLAVLAAVPLLYVVLKMLGGGYLLFLGYRLWRGAGTPIVVADAPAARGVSVWRSFVLGLATQVSNPKTAMIYAGVFASLLPREVPAFLLLVLPIIVFLIEAGWYSAVAVALSAPASRARYLASKAAIDRAAGVVISLLGVKLLFSEAARP